MAYNRGREVDTMAERHNSVVSELRLTEIDLDTAMYQLKDTRRDAERTHLAALERIDQLTADKEAFQSLYIKAENNLKEVRTALDETQNALIYACERMRIPAELRDRDALGRFVKMTAEELAGAVLNHVSDNEMTPLDIANDELALGLCKEIKANAVTDIVPKPHTLKHGMTVKNPTEDEVMDVIDEAKKAGIEIETPLKYSSEYPSIWYNRRRVISACTNDVLDGDIYITTEEFIARMRGE